MSDETDYMMKELEVQSRMWAQLHAIKVTMFEIQGLLGMQHDEAVEKFDALMRDSIASQLEAIEDQIPWVAAHLSRQLEESGWTESIAVG